MNFSIATSNHVEKVRNLTLEPLPLNRRPNNKDITDLRKNTVSVSRFKAVPNPFNPEMGFAALILNVGDYNRLAPAGAIAHHIPVHPGHAPVIPAGANATVREDQRHEYGQRWTEWTIGKELERDVKDKLIEACHVYVQELKDPETDYDNVSILDIFTHLFTRYGAPTRQMFDQTKKEIVEKWDPANQPIETFWSRCETKQQFTVGTARHISDGQLIDKALSVFEATEISFFTKASVTW